MRWPHWARRKRWNRWKHSLEELERYAIFIDDFSNPFAAGSVNGTLSSDGKAKRVATDTESKLSISGGQLVISGGKAVPAWGDPMIQYTTLADAAFALQAGYAFLVTLTSLTATNHCLVGFAGLASGTLSGTAGLYLNISNITSPDASETIRAISAGEDVSFLIPVRAREVDTYLAGYHVLEHISGHQWERRRVWVETAGSVADDEVPTVSSHSKAVTVSRIALLDLSSIMSPDFCELTDSKTNPVHASTYNVEADFHLNTAWTPETGKYVIETFRHQDDNNRLQIGMDDDSLYLQKIVATAQSTVSSVAGLFLDGVGAEVDVVAEGTSIKVYVDKVLKVDATVTEFETEEGGVVYTDLASNDITIDTHPNPALGGSVLGATDRIVCPQEDDAGTMDADAHVVVRGIGLPSADYLELQMRGA